jgi:hypothetical protein
MGITPYSGFSSKTRINRYRTTTIVGINSQNDNKRYVTNNKDFNPTIQWGLNQYIGGTRGFSRFVVGRSSMEVLH